MKPAEQGPGGERRTAASPPVQGVAEAPAPAAVGKPLTFVDVFQQHAAYVLGLLGRLGVGRADLEDVAQEVFLTVHQKLPGFEGRSSLKTWICGICLRKASDYRRRAHRKRELLVASCPEPAPDEGQPERAAMHRERLVLLQRALAFLPEPQLEVFVLYELEQLPMVDVALAVGCPRFTAYTRLRAARRAIRKQLDLLQPDGPR